MARITWLVLLTGILAKAALANDTINLTWGDFTGSAGSVTVDGSGNITLDLGAASLPQTLEFNLVAEVDEHTDDATVGVDTIGGLQDTGVRMLLGNTTVALLTDPTPGQDQASCGTLGDSYLSDVFPSSAQQQPAFALVGPGEAGFSANSGGGSQAIGHEGSPACVLHVLIEVSSLGTTMLSITDFNFVDEDTSDLLTDQTCAYGQCVGSLGYEDQVGDGANGSPALTFDLNVTSVSVIDVALRAVEADNPTSPEEGSLPNGLSSVHCGDDFLAEIWVSQVDGGMEGIGGGSVDLHFDNSLLSADAIEHGSIYDGELSSGVIDNGAGLVDDVGGATMETGHGVDPDWALLARIRMTATGTGGALFSLTHGAFAFALAGGGVPLASEAVNVSTTLTLIIADDVPPALSDCPDDVEIPCDNGFGMLTFSPPTAEDDCDASPSIECRDQNDDPLEPPVAVADGTVVTCTATDASGNSASCPSFSVICLPTCIYNLDVDLSNYIDVSDFALFAPHYATFAVEDDYFACADFYFDGVIEPADVSFFGTAFDKYCDDPSIVFPPGDFLPPPTCRGDPGGSRGRVASAAAVVGEAVTLELRTIVLASSSPTSNLERLPETWALPAKLGQEFVVEVWARMSGTAPAGLTGGTVDISVDPALATLGDVSVDSNFSLFTRGNANPALGIARGLGGATLREAVGVGDWARFATVKLRTIGRGVLAIRLTQGRMRFAEYSKGAIGEESVSLHGATLSVGAKPWRRTRERLPAAGED